jgi:hypothetical protein
LLEIRNGAWREYTSGTISVQTKFIVGTFVVVALLLPLLMSGKVRERLKRSATPRFLKFWTAAFFVPLFILTVIDVTLVEVNAPLSGQNPEPVLLTRHWQSFLQHVNEGDVVIVSRYDKAGQTGSRPRIFSVLKRPEYDDLCVHLTAGLDQIYGCRKKIDIMEIRDFLALEPTIIHYGEPHYCEYAHIALMGGR